MDPLAREAAQVVASADRKDLLLTGTSAGVSVMHYRAPPAPVVSPVPSGQRMLSLPASLPLPCFAAWSFAPESAPSHLVAMKFYPASPGSRSSSSMCYDLDGE